MMPALPSAAVLLPLLLQGATAAVPAHAPAPWTVVHLTANGAPATSTSVWAQDGKARLVVRCDTAGTPIVSLQFIPKPGFPAATPRPVAINADDNGWLGTNWQFPGNGAFVSDEVIVTNLAMIVAHAKAIRVRVIAPDNATVEAVFAGPASDAPIRAVLKACGYDLGTAPSRSAVAQPAPAAVAEPEPDGE